MASTYARQTEGGDEDNGAFGLPGEVADSRSGFEGEVAAQEGETGKDDRFRQSQKKDVPQETLADRIARRRKEG